MVRRNLVDAAVALIYEVDDDKRVKMLFIKRADNPHDPWSGDIAFPGGRRQEGDLTLLDTVYREVLEEVNLDLANNSRLITELESQRSLIRMDMVIHPFLFRLEREATDLRGNHEVDKLYWIPLDELRASRCRKFVRTMNRYWIVDCYRWNGIIIWGVTYRILNKLLNDYNDYIT